MRRHRGSFINPQGKEVEGGILLLGDFNAFYRNSDKVGFLKIDKLSAD